MKMDFQNTEQIPFMQNEQRRVRGSTLFLAELFVQLKRPEVNFLAIIDIDGNIVTYFRIHEVQLMSHVMFSIPLCFCSQNQALRMSNASVKA